MSQHIQIRRLCNCMWFQTRLKEVQICTINTPTTPVFLVEHLVMHLYILHSVALQNGKTLLYSFKSSLYGLLPSEHLECWRWFVLACRILCEHSLSNDDVGWHTILLQFYKKAQHLYGKSAITPNIHMRGHLKEVILDFVPVYECWLFERYNGILGSQLNNNRLIEPQLLRRFLRDNFVYGFNLPNEFRDEFKVWFLRYNTVGPCWVDKGYMYTILDINLTTHWDLNILKVFSL